MGMAAGYGQTNDSVYRDYSVSLTDVKVASYYFFLHTAGLSWNINKIWFE